MQKGGTLKNKKAASNYRPISFGIRKILLIDLTVSLKSMAKMAHMSGGIMAGEGSEESKRE
jgi:hypothetical protein